MSSSFQCATCDLSFHTRSELLKHSKAQEHSSSPVASSDALWKHSCADCGASFKFQYLLKSHISATHGAGFVCEICNRAYASKSELTAHQKRIHEGHRPHSSSYCQKKFHARSGLKSHTQIHTGEKPYICSTCSKSFSTIQGLSNHRRYHVKSKPYPCTNCDKSYVDPWSLRVHMRFHTGEKPYACGYCGKLFSRRAKSWTEHMRRHTGEKTYSCTYCNFRTASRGSFTGHLKRHVGEEQHPCSDCGRILSSATRLRNHVAAYHPAEKNHVCDFCGERWGSTLSC